MAEPSISKNQPRRVLSLFDSVCIIVGTIIGAGIFAMPGMVAGNLGSVWWVMGIWIIGGCVAMIGSLCFAELTTKYEEPGGDYAYLKLAYHRRVGFAFSWAAFWIIRPGNIGSMAMIFGIYADQLFHLPTNYSILIYALLTVLFLSGTNLIGVRFGKTTQNVLTVAKVLGILLIVGTAFLIPNQASELRAGGAFAGMIVEQGSMSYATTWNSFWLAMVFVMFAYGGWNDIAFVAAEVEKPQVNLMRSLMLGTGCVIGIYLLVNFALSTGLGFKEFATAGDQATKILVDNKLGHWGSRFLNALICASCAGAINGMIFTSPRIYAATAVDYPRLKWLSGALLQADKEDSGQPTQSSGWWRAMVLQTFVTIALMIECGRRSQTSGFETITICTAIYFWFFLALTVFGLVVCRFRYDQIKRAGFSTPLFPLLPLLFISACGFMVYRSLTWMHANKLWGLTISIAVLMLVGVGLSFLLGNQNSAGGEDK